MEGVVQSLTDGYTYINDEMANPITKNWFLVSSPIRIASLLVLYLYFATRLGPWYMKDKKPYDLRRVIQLYNIFQVIANSYLFCVGFTYMASNQFSFLCQNVDDPKTTRAYGMAVASWLYFLTKVIDLVDTVFFVLRKSDRQITSLHLHHHTLMPLATWIGVTYYPGGQAAVLGTVNTFVHAVMYTYYYIAGLGDKYKKYLWWKRHVTELQLTQFIIVGIHAANSLLHECGYPTWIKIGMILYAGIFINMFGQFYYYNYIVKKHHHKKDGVDKSVTEKRKSQKETLSETNNGHHNGIEADNETVRNNYRNGNHAKTQISNGVKSSLKAQ